MTRKFNFYWRLFMVGQGLIALALGFYESNFWEVLCGFTIQLWMLTDYKADAEASFADQAMDGWHRALNSADGLAECAEYWRAKANGEVRP